MAKKRKTRKPSVSASADATAVAPTSTEALATEGTIEASSKQPSQASNKDPQEEVSEQGITASKQLIAGEQNINKLKLLARNSWPAVSKSSQPATHHRSAADS